MVPGCGSEKEQKRGFSRIDQNSAIKKKLHIHKIVYLFSIIIILIKIKCRYCEEMTGAKRQNKMKIK